MIDKWFLEDINNLIKKRKRVVIIDPKEQWNFLLPLLKNKGFIILKTDRNLVEKWTMIKEELMLRYETETTYCDENVVFYVTRQENDLSFLLEYCYTYGCLDLSKSTEWLRDKLFKNARMPVTMDDSKLLMASKISVGKDIVWWKKIIQNLEDLISINDELIPFLHNPINYFKQKDEDIIRLFENLLFNILEQPYMKKPPKTLADETVKIMFNGLINNNISPRLLEIYYKWVDSSEYCSSLKDYISEFKLNKDINPWKVHESHCFLQLDKLALKLMTEKLGDKKYIEEKILYIRSRLQNIKVLKFIPVWWNDVLMLLEFDSSSINSCNSFESVVKFYAYEFSKVDRAIRNLYVAFLNDKTIIRLLQEHYENLNNELLEKWFEFSKEYKSNQYAHLVELINSKSSKIAIIVGDGVRYEIADYVAGQLEKKYAVNKEIMIAGMPSETEHNMSALYTDNYQIVGVHKDREKLLLNATNKKIRFMNLEALSYNVEDPILVLTYKDIDNVGEKLQLGALKLFEEFEKVLIEKIILLLNMGYSEVHLVTDHGFVLTGLLDESDKIEVDIKGKKEVHERFIRTVEKQTNPQLVLFKEPYNEYNFTNAARNHRPFKSKGLYGFSHGGFTPQEIVIPNFIFTRNNVSVSSFEVKIDNKSDLIDVTGDIFGIKLRGIATKYDIFSLEKKVQIVIYADSNKISNSNIINVKLDKIESLEFSFEGYNEISAILIDAETQAQLDSVIIKKSNARDLSGLFD